MRRRTGALPSRRFSECISSFRRSRRRLPTSAPFKSTAGTLPHFGEGVRRLADFIRQLGKRAARPLRKGDVFHGLEVDLDVETGRAESGLEHDGRFDEVADEVLRGAVNFG